MPPAAVDIRGGRGQKMADGVRLENRWRNSPTGPFYRDYQFIAITVRTDPTGYLFYQLYHLSRMPVFPFSAPSYDSSWPVFPTLQSFRFYLFIVLTGVTVWSPLPMLRPVRLYRFYRIWRDRSSARPLLDYTILPNILFQRLLVLPLPNPRVLRRGQFYLFY